MSTEREKERERGRRDKGEVRENKEMVAERKIEMVTERKPSTLTRHWSRECVVVSKAECVWCVKMWW